MAKDKNDDFPRLSDEPARGVGFSAGTPQYQRITLRQRLEGYFPQGHLDARGQPVGGWTKFEGGLPPEEHLPGLLAEASAEIDRLRRQVRDCEAAIEQVDPQRDNHYPTLIGLISGAERLAAEYGERPAIRILYDEERGKWRFIWTTGKIIAFQGWGADLEGAAVQAQKNAETVEANPDGLSQSKAVGLAQRVASQPGD